MKNVLKATLFLFLIANLNNLNAQERVREKDLVGKSWQLIIDLEETLEEEKQDMEDEDSFLGRMILSSVAGLVTSIMDEIEIFMEFQADGQVEIQVYAFDEEEVEYTNWYIDENGRLFIDDTDSFKSGHDYWLYEDGILVSFENGRRQKEVYMVRLDQ